MRGGSGRSFGGRRTGIDRLDAIPAAMTRKDEFMERLKAAEGDAVRLSDMMAEAIAMDREARTLEPVGRDGRTMLSVEGLFASHCMDAARDAYLKARGSNQPCENLSHGQSDQG